MILLGVLAAVTAAGVSPAATPYEDIRIGSVVLRVPFPAGFCKPKGEDAAVMDQLAAGDQENVTHLSLIECKPTAADRYYLLKTPTDAVNESFERSEALKGIAETVESPGFSEQLNGETSRQVGEEKTQAFGTKTEITSDLGVRGHDDVCVYMGGMMTTSAGGKSQTQAIGSCMTVIGHRLMSITLYQDSKDPAAYKKLLPEVKALALRIQARN